MHEFVMLVVLGAGAIPIVSLLLVELVRIGISFVSDAPFRSLIQLSDMFSREDEYALAIGAPVAAAAIWILVAMAWPLLVVAVVVVPVLYGIRAHMRLRKEIRQIRGDD